MRVTAYALVHKRSNGGFKAGGVWTICTSLVEAEIEKDRWAKSRLALDIVPCGADYEPEGT